MGQWGAPFRRYRFGAAFADGRSGLRVEGHHPAHRPDRWLAYLDGAEARYRHHRIERALNRPTLEDGGTVSLFWVVLDGDRTVAGVRCHGPLVAASDAYALGELAAHDRLDDIRASIVERVPSGVIEFKGGWVALGRSDNDALSEAVARCFVHSMDWFGVRYGMCTASTVVARRWASSGGRAVEGIAAIPYPDERYDTVLLWWDGERLSELATAEQLERVAAETAELWVTSGPSRVSAPADDWRAVVLDPSDPADARTVAQLVASPALDVVDELPGQVEELRKLRPSPSPQLLGETPRWVYYPWRRSLVRVLGPAAFRRLRLDRNRNKLTAEEQAQLASRRVGVVGLSVGHVVAHTLALEGLCGELRLADFDRIELSNLNRIPATTLDLGVNKAVLAARRIAEIDPYLTMNVVCEGASAANVDELVAGLDVVIEECDSLDVKLLVREAARRHGVPVIMETSDRGMLDVERFDLEPTRALFHGLVDDLRVEDLAGLSTHDKVPYVLRILEPAELSARMAASMAEIDETVTTWPQLGSDVVLGAATVAAAVRRLGRGESLPSGRVRVDLSALLDELVAPTPAPLLVPTPPPQREPAPTEVVKAVVHAANQAPSGGNTQPWRFEADDQELRIFLDRARTSAMDVRFRGSYVAIGAALFNARVAAANHARLGDVELFPNEAVPDHVATLRLGETLDLALAELYPAVLARNANRHEGRPAPISSQAAAELAGAAAREGARLTMISDRGAVEEYAELLAESDRLRYLSPTLHREMMSELRWPGRDRLETGIDVRTLELDDSDLAKLAVAQRADVMAQLASWNAGRALGEVTRDRVRSSSAIVVVTITAADPAAYVRGGAAVERVWVTAEHAGLAVQPVSPVFVFALDGGDFADLVPPQFVGPLRALAERFRALASMGPEESVALVLRVSHAPAPSVRSLRLPLSAALSRPAPPGALSRLG